MASIVGCFKCTHRAELIDTIQKALSIPHIDILEVRLDFLPPTDIDISLISEIRQATSKPLILTIRDVTEGGMHDIPIEIRQELFLVAIRAHYEYLDIEFTNVENFPEILNTIPANQRLILSVHQTLPDQFEPIANLIDQMTLPIPVIKKLVFTCPSPENTSQLESYQLRLWERYPKESLTIFAEGSWSLFSRTYGYMNGNALTYVSVAESMATAKGQPTIHHFRQKLEILRSMQLGTLFSVQAYGESHGFKIGCIVRGFPPDKSLDLSQIRNSLRVRSPGHHALTSPRKEKDEFEITNGLFDGRGESKGKAQDERKTTGGPLRFIIKNQDVHPEAYHQFTSVPRPSHVGYPAKLRYGDSLSLSGGGIFSGRLTIPFVIGGSLAIQLLAEKDVRIKAFVSQIGSIRDSHCYTWKEITSRIFSSLVDNPDQNMTQQMENEIAGAKKENDSIGGQISMVIEHFPAGHGDPWFHSLESRLASAIMGIPGIRGIEFGTGFRAAGMHGSEHNDPFILDQGQISTRSNHCGGIIGGISLGTPIRFQIAVKPTASIGKPQSTLNFTTKQMDTLTIAGRHDPCIVPRVVPVVESIVAIVLLNVLLEREENGELIRPKL